MSAEIGSIHATLLADLSQFAQGFNKASRIVASTTDAMQGRLMATDRAISRVQATASRGVQFGSLQGVTRSFETLNSRVDVMRSTMLGFVAVLGSVGSALAVNAVLRYADSYTSIINQMRTVSKRAGDLESSLAGAFDVASISRSGVRETTTLFTRLSLAAPDLNPQKILRYVETIQKGLQLGGATAQEAASAAIQFSQAIGANRLQGEELRALLETPLGARLAQGLGVTISEMRKLGEQGELTAARVLGALDSVSSSIDRDFSKTTATLDQNLVGLDNAFTKYIGKADQAYGGTRLMSESIQAFANNLDTILPLIAAVGGGLAAVFVGKNLGRGAGAIVQGIQSIGAAAREARDSAREAVRTTELSLVDAGMRRSEAGRERFGDVSGFAPGAMIKEAQRLQVELNNADEKHIGLLAQRQQAYIDLAKVSASIPAGLAAEQERMVKSEQRVNALLTQQTRLRKDLRGAQTTGALLGAASSITRASNAPVTQNLREQADLAAQIAKTEAKVSAEREKGAALAASVAQRTAEIDAVAANQRIAALRQIASIEKSINDQSLDRAVLSGTLRDQNGAIVAAGQRQVNAAFMEADQAMNAASQSAAQARQQLGALERAATTTGVAMSALRNVSFSLYSFLGGPWGVGLTAATVALGLFAAASAKAAQEERLRSDALKRAADQGDRISQQSAAQVALSDASADLANFQAQQQELVDRARGLFRQSLNIGGARGSQAMVNLAQMQPELDAIVKSLADGTTNVDQFSARIEALLARTGGGRFLKNFQELGNSIAGNRAQILEAETAIEGLKTQLVSLTPPKALGNAQAMAQAIGGIAGEAKDAASPMQAMRDATAKMSDELARAALNASSLDDARQIQFADRLTQATSSVVAGLQEMQMAAEAAGESGLSRLVANFSQGAISADSFRSAVSKIAQENPRLAATAKQFIEISLRVERAMTAVDSLQAAIKRFTGASVDLRKKIGEFFGAGNESEIAKALRVAGMDDRGQRLQQARDRYGSATEEQIKRLIDLEDQQTEAKKRKADAERDANQAREEAQRKAERFAESMSELETRSLAASANLSDVDMETIRYANSAGIAEQEIRNFIAAVRSGDFSAVTPDLMRIRDAMTSIGAQEAAVERARDLNQALSELRIEAAIASSGLSEIDRQTIEFAQSAGFAEEQIRAMLGALQTGDYSALDGVIGQAREQLKIIDDFQRSSEAIDQSASDMAGAFKDFASSVIRDADNIGDHLRNLFQRIADMFLNVAFNALEEGMKGWFGSLLGGLRGAQQSGAPTAGGLASGLASGLAAIAAPPASVRRANLAPPAAAIAAPAARAAARGPASYGLLGSYARSGVNIAGLSPEFAKRLTNALQGMPAHLAREIQIVSAHRTVEHQARLYAAFKAGTGGRAAPPGGSQHNFGNAVDVNWGQMSPAARAAWIKSAEGSGLARQYSFDGHWGPALGGKNGLAPWRPRHGELSPWGGTSGVNGAQEGAQALDGLKNMSRQAADSLGELSQNSVDVGGALSHLGETAGMTGDGLFNALSGAGGKISGAGTDLASAAQGVAAQGEGLFGSIVGALGQGLGQIFEGVGGGLGGFGQLFGGLLGLVGNAAGSGIPTYHSGLLPNEYMAVLERGEAVLTSKVSDRTMGVMKGLANDNRKAAPKQPEIHMHIAAAGEEAMAKVAYEATKKGLSAYNRGLLGNVRKQQYRSRVA
jgi:tape measure domain-containing protein